ncbi:HAD family hydrolase [Jiella pacifica]|uniref:HAD-IA family hydrolase n=1 Tax=Jiella pacifica TaxID=2696469 RepID=A0A6N9T7J5_9HYPH|nr:HAD family hydrolase [Jiella pacifica]NDW07384.1 HAD-IA family hydrolase [Jiella pacifica]
MIIFDCDGVLVDSEILSNDIDAELMSAAGYPITAAALIRGYIGRPKAEIWAAIAEERGVPWPDGLLEKADALLLERIETDLQPVAGVAEALALIPGRKAVASSSALPKLRKALARCGLLEIFDPAVFSASQVAHGKPAPDVFLHAARECGVPAERCLVVEDSVAGVHAGLAAGMRVIGFTGGLHSYSGHAAALLAAGAVEIVTNMCDLSDMVSLQRP